MFKKKGLITHHYNEKSIPASNFPKDCLDFGFVFIEQIENIVYVAKGRLVLILRGKPGVTGKYQWQSKITNSNIMKCKTILKPQNS